MARVVCWPAGWWKRAARFINVYFAAHIGGRKNSGGWDTHGFDNNPMYPVLKEYLLPITDQTLPTLIEDLEARGLLDSTLVVWVGEFGRSPKINKLAGRDHWPQCYTALLAGGGVKAGALYGASDKIGAYPAADAVRPDDLAATMYYLLGIDPAHRSGRCSQPAAAHLAGESHHGDHELTG